MTAILDSRAIRAADPLAALFETAGYARAEPGLLQPAESFLELSGEDIRRRLYLTQDAQGRELCLRPEFTIPVCREYLARDDRPATASHWYHGPVFRHRAQGSGEFVQAGIESFGRNDREAADAEILDLALQACGVLGAGAPQVSLGDVGLIEAFFAALALPADLTRRLRKALAAGQPVAPVLEAAAAGHGGSLAEFSGLLGALEGVDKREARAFVEDVLSIAGLTSVGGRSIGDIAERFLARAASGAAGVSGEHRALIERFLGVSGDPDAVSAQLRALAGEAGLDIGAALDSFDTRTGFMAARGIDVSMLHMQAGFSRNLDYYSGFVFELTLPGAVGPLVGGGRYDRLLSRLGAGQPIPAVGCSIWIERFGRAA